jgi:sugar/nucleoside kinase (ribokinase family)
VTGSAAPEIVFLGNFMVDDVVFRDGRVRMGEAGGAMLYAALAASLWGTRCAVVSVAGSDYPDIALEALVARGVDLSGVRRLDRPGIRTWLLEETEGRRIVHQLGRPSHAEMSPAPSDLPVAFRSARAFHLAPMPFDVQRRLLDELSTWDGALVSLDPHERLREDNRSEWSAVFDRVDAVFLSEDEMRLAGASEDPRGALARLSGARLRIAAFKRGPQGGMLRDLRGSRSIEWSGSTDPAVDSTGAGDAFAAGLPSGLVAGESIDGAIERGAVSASFAIEDWGARGLIGATRERAEQRRKAWFPAGAAHAERRA